VSGTGRVTIQLLEAKPHEDALGSEFYSEPNHRPANQSDGFNLIVDSPFRTVPGHLSTNVLPGQLGRVGLDESGRNLQAVPVAVEPNWPLAGH
jgi:hypothetical protein